MLIIRISAHNFNLPDTITLTSQNHIKHMKKSEKRPNNSLHPKIPPKYNRIKNKGPLILALDSVIYCD